MNFDAIIIGGGISGLICGIKLASGGIKCAVVSAGMSALHFSSGSIDLMGTTEKGDLVEKPYDYLESAIEHLGEHPYAACGISMIRESMGFFRDQLATENLTIYHDGDNNHFHITPLGTLKPTFYSQESVYNDTIKRILKNKSRIALLNFEGYRDFYPELAISNLRKIPRFSDIEFVPGKLLFPDYGSAEKNPFEYRSVDIARIFDNEEHLPHLASQIKKAAAGAQMAALPAFIGITNYKKHLALIQEMSGVTIYEIPTLPPSILGMRIDNVLKNRFSKLGGLFIAGDRITGGKIHNGRLVHIFTKNSGANPLSAHNYVLATGSFLSGGLAANYHDVKEPVFDLSVRYLKEREQWSSSRFFSNHTHNFLEFGVTTNERLNPTIRSDGKTVQNLYCTGALLGGYNPIRENSGGGVAIATGYTAACSIMGELVR